MRIPFMDMSGRIVEILDSKDLTDNEWKLVKANKSGALSMRDLPGGKRSK